MSENSSVSAGPGEYIATPTDNAGTKYPIEKKVSAASLLGYVGSAVLFYVITGVSNDPEVLTPIPDAIEPLVLALIPGLLSLAGGFFAKHQKRV